MEWATVVLVHSHQRSKKVKTIVRCPDRMVFEIDPVTLNSKQTSRYDAYCFTDPLPDVKYISHGEWCRQLNKQWDKLETQNENL